MQADRILDGMNDAPDFYFERVAQIRVPRWSRGRIALLGDAAYCASPVSGMGTSLALTGAYILAGELATRPDHRDALAAYESTMRSYVVKAQKLPPGVPAIANPRTGFGIAALHTAVRAAATPLAQRVLAGRFSPPSDSIELTRYQP